MTLKMTAKICIFLYLFIYILTAAPAFAEINIGIGAGSTYGGAVGLGIEYADKDIFDKRLAANVAIGVLFDHGDNIGWSLGLRYYLRKKSFNPFLAYRMGIYKHSYSADRLLVSPAIVTTGFRWNFYKGANFDFEFGSTLIGERERWGGDDYYPVA